MQWRHEVNPEWLRARRECLTATDAIKMIPEVKRAVKKLGSPGLGHVWHNTPPNRRHIIVDVYDYPVALSILASKIALGSDEDPVSYGAAARGHILEADFFKRIMFDDWCHWDDVVVRSERRPAASFPPVGFSPDGFRGMQQGDVYEWIRDRGGSSPSENTETCFMSKDVCLYHRNHLKDPIEFFEIKAYEPAHYLKAISTPKYMMPERYQIAMGHVVLNEENSKSNIVFYCPEFVESKQLVYRDENIGYDHYQISPVMKFHWEYDELKNEIMMIKNARALLGMVSAALYDAMVNVDGISLEPFVKGNLEWETIDVIHDEWEQNQSTMFGGK